MKNEIAGAMKTVKGLIYIVMMVLSPGICLAMDHVVISEVLYDPVATETDGEAVEIYNPTEAAIDISGYAIKTESSATDATIPAGTTLAAHTFYLVADTGWSSLKDNTSWPNADQEDAITMSNADAGVAIVYPNGTIIDAVGWGNAAGIGAGLYEGTPTSLVTSGKSIRRTNLASDTGDNLADFTESTPELQNSSTTTSGGDDTGGESEGNSLELNVEVENNAPTVSEMVILLDDDNSTTGVQIMPVPEGIKLFQMSADVSDADGTEDLQTVTATIRGPSGTRDITMTKTQDVSSTTARYNATIDMQYYDGAGMYNATITAEDYATTAQSNTQFEYLGMVAISIDASALQFSGARIGGTAEVDGDYALSTADSPTIKNTGNTPIDVGLYGTDLVDGAKNISIGNVKYSFDDDFGSDLSGTLAKTLQVQAIGLENSDDSVISLGFQLFVPPTTQNGNYTGSVTIVAMRG